MAKTPQIEDEEVEFEDKFVAPILPKCGPIELDDFKLDVNYYLTKDYEDIATAAQELPAIVEWINCKLQQMTEAKLRKEAEVKEAESEAWFYLLNGGFEDRNYAGRKNVQAVLMGVTLDPQVKKAKGELAVLTGWYQRLLNTMRSFQAKLELVRTAEATRRKIFASEDTQS